MTKKFHYVEISVFGDNIPGIEPEVAPEFLSERLMELVKDIPGKHKVEIEELDPVEGFSETLTVAKIRLEKQADKFMEESLKWFSKDQLERVKETIDEDVLVYIRIERDLYLSEGEIKYTESGNCIHIRAKIAAYPAKKENAIKVFEELCKE